MAQYLLLDKNRNALNSIEWDGVTPCIFPPEVSEVVAYSGQFGPGWAFDGTALIDPNPPVPTPVPEQPTAQGVELI